MDSSPARYRVVVDLASDRTGTDALALPEALCGWLDARAEHAGGIADRHTDVYVIDDRDWPGPQ